MKKCQTLNLKKDLFLQFENRGTKHFKGQTHFFSNSIMLKYTFIILNKRNIFIYYFEPQRKAF